MSKPVRLADYLYAQIEELAVTEKRSLANMVQVLLEQALKIETVEPASRPPSALEKKAAGEYIKAKVDSHFKPDFK